MFSSSRTYGQWIGWCFEAILEPWKRLVRDPLKSMRMFLWMLKRLWRLFEACTDFIQIFEGFNQLGHFPSILIHSNSLTFFRHFRKIFQWIRQETWRFFHFFGILWLFQHFWRRIQLPWQLVSNHPKPFQPFFFKISCHSFRIFDFLTFHRVDFTVSKRIPTRLKKKKKFSFISLHSGSLPMKRTKILQKRSSRNHFQNIFLKNNNNNNNRGCRLDKEKRVARRFYFLPFLIVFFSVWNVPIFMEHHQNIAWWSLWCQAAAYLFSITDEFFLISEVNLITKQMPRRRRRPRGTGRILIINNQYLTNSEDSSRSILNLNPLELNTGLNDRYLTSFNDSSRWTRNVESNWDFRS